jgi:SAM-dependent methyltransferase
VGDEGEADLQRRLAREVAIFEGQEALHQHAPAFGWRNAQFLAPALTRAFGRDEVHAIYAETLAAAVQRTGAATVFSLGCGDGAQEIAVLRRADALGLPRFRIQGLELAPAVVARANAAAAAAGYADRFEALAGDLNAGLPGDGPVAAVMAHHALHHFVALEAIFDSVAARLHPEGAFVTFDMIGRNGHMRWLEVRPLVRRLWAMLPPDRRHDHMFGCPRPYFQDWDCAIEGFEGVRAQDILGLLAERFLPERLVAWGGLTDVFISPRQAPNFDIACAEDRAFLTAVTLLEQRLLAERRTTPTEMAAVFRSRRGRFRPEPKVAAALARALRRPGETFASLESEAFPSPYRPLPAPPPPALRLDEPEPLGPGTPAAATLREGWEAPHPGGAWAILDEQSLAFTLPEPAKRVVLRVWSNLPAHRGPAISAEATGGAAAATGPLGPGDLRDLALVAPAPRRDWEIRLRSAAYRRPDEDGGADLRPLAYQLASITALR